MLEKPGDPSVRFIDHNLQDPIVSVIKPQGPLTGPNPTRPQF